MTSQLVNFIADARAATYASGKKAELGEGKHYFFENGEFAYRDIYYDQAKTFQGQEVVFKNNKPIWSFSYRGSVESDERAHGIFSFLRQSLRELKLTARLHTVCSSSSGKWNYQCSGLGNFEEFSGQEVIDYEGVRVYLMQYFGGDLI
ncbi:MAG: hypothetical protein HW387_1461 [Parachlamydiales bacterium]|nr:hypothetical protein [Parachlamydiales bacterium]